MKMGVVGMNFRCNMGRLGGRLVLLSGMHKLQLIKGLLPALVMEAFRYI